MLDKLEPPTDLRANAFTTELDDALDRFILGCNFSAETAHLRFPPVIELSLLKRNNYFVGFPHLAGCIHSFAGSAEDHQSLLYNLLCDEPIDSFLGSTGLALTPAACYPVYPAVAQQGPLPAGGRVISVHSWCFRHEPSRDPARRRAFRMREFIYLGSAEGAQGFRDDWMKQASRMTEQLGLDGRLDAANDPFFGGEATPLTAHQRERSLKFEMLLPITSRDKPNACMSFNYHETHFAGTWDIRQADGAVAHTACVGFGIERVVLALIAAHGADRAGWPVKVKDVLWPAS
ncbi:class-II aminoacyl-tRNA synthetase family protein [Acidisoma sp. C75]